MMKNPAQSFEWNYRNTIIAATVAILTSVLCMGVLEAWPDVKADFWEGWTNVING